MLWRWFFNVPPLKCMQNFGPQGSSSIDLWTFFLQIWIDHILVITMLLLQFFQLLLTTEHQLHFYKYEFPLPKKYITLLSLVQFGRAALQEKIKIWKSIQTMAAKWKQDISAPRHFVTVEKKCQIGTAFSLKQTWLPFLK